jgi:hypothetical protein
MSWFLEASDWLYRLIADRTDAELVGMWFLFGVWCMVMLVVYAFGDGFGNLFYDDLWSFWNARAHPVEYLVRCLVLLTQVVAVIAPLFALVINSLEFPLVAIVGICAFIFTLAALGAMIDPAEKLYGFLDENRPDLVQSLNWNVFRRLVEPFTRTVLITGVLVGIPVIASTGARTLANLPMAGLFLGVLAGLVAGHLGGMATVLYFNSPRGKAWQQCRVWFLERSLVYMLIWLPVFMSGMFLMAAVFAIGKDILGIRELVLVDFWSMLGWSAAPLAVSYLLPKVGGKKAVKRRIFHPVVNAMSGGAAAFLLILFFVLR